MVSILIAFSSVKYILFPLGEYVIVTNPGVYTSSASRDSIIHRNLSENEHLNPLRMTYEYVSRSLDIHS
ncbi:hypothetical protein AR158_c219R [Paramecium bursaria Chlorella virus AR158]|uniref:hypothetical protein n=1 Tax=Paramecium bursaria Chlorella virus AR158 TaxID=380598 RepID=UPI00015AA877|nr:hypothetical protein AR158_c219R [Paramecium bursaria Chlorella virus AR158]ABU43765.1 hypothetical protein AR158_c219R [Paramecium bursaria Chlorella virus AR158]